MNWFSTRSSRCSRRSAMRRNIFSFQELEARVVMDGMGFVATDFDGGSDGASAVVIQSNGRIVAAGESDTTIGRTNYRDFALARFTTDGSLDSSFSGDGKVYSRTTGDDWINGLAIQPDQKIVAVGGGYGTTKNGSVSKVGAVAIARYNPDGSLDASFGTNGRVFTEFGKSGTTGTAFAVEVQSDGKLVVAGTVNGAFAVMRYTTNGLLDKSFGGTGWVTTDFGLNSVLRAQSLAIQSDGKIIAASGLGKTDYFLLARYNPDGRLDSSFDGDGKIVHFLGNHARINDIALQPDGKIVAAGMGHVVRYETNGAVDNTFGNSGVERLPTMNVASLGFQSDGKIVLTGNDNGVYGRTIRLLADGNLDTAFDGTVGVGQFAYMTWLAVQADDTIVVVGGDGPDFLSMRLTPDGALDTSWGGSMAFNAANSIPVTDATSTQVATADVAFSTGSLDSTLSASLVDEVLGATSALWKRRDRFTR